MYNITYERTQWRIKEPSGYVEGPIHLAQAPYQLDSSKKHDTEDEKSRFHPTSLVRVSDMQVVPGSSVHEGYCALSYSWNQSGKFFHRQQQQQQKKSWFFGIYGDMNIKNRNEQISFQEKAHKIIEDDNITMTTTNSNNKTMTVPKKKRLFFANRNNSTRKSTTETTRHVEHVRFEQLIQQIAKDFGVTYLWYDQMCIDQNLDPMEKARAIQQQKHQVFQHADYTIALVPELELINPNIQKNNSDKTHERNSPSSRSPLQYANMNAFATTEWSKRMWIMEEAYMSKKILFVGRNVFLVSNEIDYQSLSPTPQGQLLYGYLSCKKTTPWNAGTLLWYTKTRTSSYSHDRIYALINMMPHILGGMRVDYKRPILDVAIEFYERVLATQDLSILLFGIPVNYQVKKAVADGTPSDTMDRTIVTQPWDNKLPTWAGTTGIHLPHATSDDCEKLISSNSYNYKNFNSNHKKCYTSSSLISFGISCSYYKVYVYNPDSIFDENKRTMKQSDQAKISYLPPMNLGSKVSQHKILSEHDRNCYRFVRISHEQGAALPDMKKKVGDGKHQQNVNATYRKLCGLKASHVLPVRRYTDASYTARHGPLDFISSFTESPTHIASWLSLVDDTSSEVFILSDIKYFVNRQFHVAMPVVAKVRENSSSSNSNQQQQRYKAVGVCIMEARGMFDPKLEQPKQEFVII